MPRRSSLPPLSRKPSDPDLQRLRLHQVFRRPRYILFFTVTVIGLLAFWRFGTSHKSSGTIQPFNDPSDDSGWPELNEFCIGIDYTAFRGKKLTSPKAAFVAKGNINDAHVSVGIPGVVCVVVALPISPKPSTNHKKFPDYSADSLILTARSSQVIYPFEVHPVLGYPNTYAAPVTVLHEGQYTLHATIEYQNYEWNSEPGLPYPLWSPVHIPTNTSITASRYLPANVVLPTKRACGPKTDMRGRWFKAGHFRKENPFDYWASPELEDDHGYLFVPDRCRPKYFSPEEQLSCLRDRVMHVYGDSNTRRALKTLSTKHEWCKSGGICDCEDRPEDDEPNTKYPWAADNSIPLVIPDKNSTIYFHFIGGLIQYSTPWIDLLKSDNPRPKNLPRADIVLVTLGNWDTAFTPFSEYAEALDDFAMTLRSYYPSQPLILRAPNPFCCTVMNERHWTRLRVKAFHDLTLAVFRRLGAIIWDISVLGGREDFYNLGDCDNRSNHARSKIVRVENQLLANAICVGNSKL